MLTSNATIWSILLMMYPLLFGGFVENHLEWTLWPTVFAHPGLAFAMTDAKKIAKLNMRYAHTIVAKKEESRL